jgi:hypothetical protein
VSSGVGEDCFGVKLLRMRGMKSDGSSAQKSERERDWTACLLINDLGHA